MEAKDLQGLFNDVKSMAENANSIKDKLSKMIASLPEDSEQRKLVEKQLDEISKQLGKLPTEIENAVNNRG